MKRILSLAFIVACTGQAMGFAVTSSFTVTGTSGNYVLDFTFGNNSGDSTMFLYFFGVDLPDNHGGNPAGYIDNLNFNPFGDGSAPNINFENTWFTATNSPQRIANGNTLSGFKVNSAALTAPTTVTWFAYGFDSGSDYDGHDSFSGPDRIDWNPGFTGTIAPVPEPATMALAGLALTAAIRRRKARRS